MEEAKKIRHGMEKARAKGGSEEQARLQGELMEAREKYEEKVGEGGEGAEGCEEVFVCRCAECAGGG